MSRRNQPDEPDSSRRRPAHPVAEDLHQTRVSGQDAAPSDPSQDGSENRATWLEPGAEPPAGSPSVSEITLADSSLPTPQDGSATWIASPESVSDTPDGEASEFLTDPSGEDPVAVEDSGTLVLSALASPHRPEQPDDVTWTDPAVSSDWATQHSGAPDRPPGRAALDPTLADGDSSSDGSRTSPGTDTGASAPLQAEGSAGPSLPVDSLATDHKAHAHVGETLMPAERSATGSVVVPGTRHADSPGQNGAAEATRPIHRGHADHQPTQPSTPSGRRPRLPLIPGYEILSVLGKGGMGVVYKARDVRLDRVVALKMILAGDQAGREALARFRIEARAVALLRHPNIVQVYETGEVHGKPYVTLEYLDGGTLQQHLDGIPQKPREAAQLIGTLARAMHYAHERGIVHRDLKPANVLLDVDGTPKITDFGLAKRLEQEDQGQTNAEAILGTPTYMAPEQAAGKTREVGPAADVYALGAILYDVLTGRPPLRGTTIHDTLNLVLNTEPVPPRRLQPNVPADLQTICLKCLNKDVARRYPSAGALADDLDRFLTGRPIEARPTSMVERLVKWARRRPAEALLVLVSTLSVVGLIVGLALYADEARRRSNEDRIRANALEVSETAAKVARVEADLQRDQAEGARKAAEQARTVALQEKDRANANLTEAQAVVEFLISVAQRDLRDEPYQSKLRNSLSEEGLKFSLRILARQGTDRESRVLVARGYRLVGEIRAAQGRLREAEQAYLRAAQEFKDLEPQDRDSRFDLALTLLNLWEVQKGLRDHTQAADVLRAGDLLLVGSGQLPDALVNLALAGPALDGYSPAAATLAQARGLFSALEREAPDNVACKLNLALCLNKEGIQAVLDAGDRDSRFARAEPAFKATLQKLAELEKLPLTPPKRVACLLERTQAEKNLAVLYQGRGRRDDLREAALLLQDALKTIEELRTNKEFGDSHRVAYRRLFGEVSSNLAVLNQQLVSSNLAVPNQQLRNYDIALEVGDKAVACYRDLAREFDDADYKQLLALALGNRAEVNRDRARSALAHNDPLAARACLDLVQRDLVEERGLLTGLVDGPNGKADQALELARVLNRLGRTYRELGQADPATKAWEDVLAVCVKWLDNRDLGAKFHAERFQAALNLAESNDPLCRIAPGKRPDASTRDHLIRQVELLRLIVSSCQANPELCATPSAASAVLGPAAALTSLGRDTPRAALADTRLVLARVHAFLKEWKEAADVLADLADAPPGWTRFPDAALFAAQCLAQTQVDPGLSDAQRAQQRGVWRPLVLKLLEQANASRLVPPPGLVKDPAFVPFYGDTEFRTFAQRGAGDQP